MVLILGAMDSEISAFVDCIDCTAEHELLPNLLLREGLLDGHPVALAKSGVGKAMSALCCQRIIDYLRDEASHGVRRQATAQVEEAEADTVQSPTMLVFTGLAGALNPELRIGDVILARDTVQHDLDTRALGHARGTVPDSQNGDTGAPYRFMPSDEGLLHAAMTYQPHDGKVHCGRILTGDQFISERDSAHYAYMRDELHGDAVEMEGAAVALCAAMNGIPFLLARTISDEADGSAKVNFRQFVPQASAKSVELVRCMLRVLNY